MKRAVASALALAITLTATTALAADPRLVEHPYDPAEVVVVEGKTNIQATIAFSDEEFIENVAIGDSGSWQVTPNKRANLLFVKPLAETAATNMTVVTNLRTYLFDLVADPDNQPLYVLRFTYAEEAAPEGKPEQQAQGLNSIEEQAVSDPYAVADPDRLNFAWKAQGNAKLLPSQIYDDGESVFLSWPNGAAVPAILIMNDEELEGPVNYAVRGDTVVVDGVPSELILRSGDDRAVLVHEGPVQAQSSISANRQLAHAGEKQ
jgi:type IV secretion system protein VirB9